MTTEHADQPAIIPIESLPVAKMGQIEVISTQPIESPIIRPRGPIHKSQRDVLASVRAKQKETKHHAKKHRHSESEDDHHHRARAGHEASNRSTNVRNVSSNDWRDRVGVDNESDDDAHRMPHAPRVVKQSSSAPVRKLQLPDEVADFVFVGFTDIEVGFFLLCQYSFANIY